MWRMTHTFARLTHPPEASSQRGGVYTSEMSGIELARKIRETDQSVQIIFITGYPEFAPEGYDVSALHYLMKPVKREKFFEVLNRAVTALAEAPQFILLPNGKEWYTEKKFAFSETTPVFLRDIG